MQELVSLRKVGMSYRGNIVLKNVNMSIKTNQPIALMGENGCGKSTLLRIIAGILSCTEGKLEFRQKLKISYVPDRFPKLPFNVEDYLIHMGKIQGVPGKVVSDYINTKFSCLNMPQSIGKQKIYKCSKGTIQKINILQALISKPDLLVLDEPFSGLDEDSVDVVMELLREAAEDSTAIVLSCHEKELAQKLTDEIYIIREQQCHINSDLSSYFSVKFVVTNHDSEFDTLIDGMVSMNRVEQQCDAVVEKGKLKEVLLFLFEKGYEIHSINPKYTPTV